ncbi:hypothetical protein DPMN_121038 [Dreissena polymorpha]|uniref:Uncharacterized protein n=1 Tax=Dreissena polymorpha TaxID=45954 RepID=A0A9D4JQQ9_DREPO|nr:hypothetical protein DPMN_121038 [Dreissena polymorpha]
MENEKYVAVGAGQQIADTGKINAVIELGEYLLTSNRTQRLCRTTNTLALYNMSLEEILRRVFTTDEIGRFGAVKDMAKISPSRFAVLMSNGDLWIMELNEDLLGFRLVEKLSLAQNSSSICYQRNFIFAAVTRFARTSYIQQTLIKGEVQEPTTKESAKRKYKHSLLSKSIRILAVDPDFVMYVCDKKRKLLYIFGKDTFSDSLMISEKTTHRYRVLDIARSAEGATYMATDSSDGVVVLHKNRQ